MFFLPFLPGGGGGGNFCEFLFASLKAEAQPELFKANSFRLRVVLPWEGIFGRVASPESVLININSNCCYTGIWKYGTY